MTNAEFVHLAFLAFTEERWKSVPDFPAYDVSSWGKVRSYWKRLKGGERIAWGIGDAPRILPPVIRPSGHHSYVLTSGVGGKRFSTTANVLVLMAFDRMPEPGEESRHVHDPDPSNNHLWNLAWGTKTENRDDEVRHRGVYTSSKLTPDQVREARSLRRGGMLQKDIASRLGVTVMTISNLLSGKCYSHVPDEAVA
jgi:DNA-binding CsgD family transcriptional regulator